MLKKVLIIAGLILLTACMGLSSQHRNNQTVYHILAGRQTSISDLAPRLKQERIIIVGEHHSNKQHHRAQLNVIRALQETGAQVVIGLEMFRSDSQAELNRWIAGDLNRPAFKQIYYDNWTFPWEAYEMIFEYARGQQVPMIGLNVSRRITAQVARQGFDSLTENQRGKLADITCRVDQAYMDYIRRAFGAHAHGKLDFKHFCEAQLVWDSIMAVNAIDYLRANPKAVMVLLCGVGHAQKAAIPRQIKNRSTMTHTVLIPEIPNSVTIDSVTAEDADFLLRMGK